MRRNLAALLFGASLFAAPLCGADLAILGQYYGTGVHHYNAGNYLAAHEDLNAAITGGSEDPRAFYFRGLSLLNLGSENEAIADFKKGAELEALDSTGFYQVGRSLERVQGSRRLQLEKYRAAARVALYQKAQEARNQRYEVARGNEAAVLRNTPLAKERSATVAPTPLVAIPKGADQAAAPAAVVPATPMASDPFGSPAAEPATTTPMAEDPFGTPAAEAPATPAPATPAPATPPAADNPFGEPEAAAPATEVPATPAPATPAPATPPAADNPFGEPEAAAPTTDVPATPAPATPPATDDNPFDSSASAPATPPASNQLAIPSEPRIASNTSRAPGRLASVGRALGNVLGKAVGNTVQDAQAAIPNPATLVPPPSANPPAATPMANAPEVTVEENIFDAPVVETPPAGAPTPAPATEPNPFDDNSAAAPSEEANPFDAGTPPVSPTPAPSESNPFDNTPAPPAEANPFDM
ncbi:MAG: tetratricopeptide repeat protein [Pirellulales bacterium]|nr:tetratricopeptide repeat protein [Pirellulales bacterium]